MKLNNKKSKVIAQVINLVLGLLFVLALLMLNKIVPTPTFMRAEYVIGILIVAFGYIAVRGWQYYELDTSGEGFTLKVKRIDWFSFLSIKEKHIDLPKYKLQNYIYNKGVFNDDLTLLINSRKSKGNTIKVKFRLSLLSDNDREKIIMELEKIISSNNQFQIDSKVA
ncbi:hypothetical protein [Faecalibacter sp. LW9]|uniref:hypothetical protein n=1 Tax=Faecalibacter sp. LW9 TaxID=3103144 RepID=UPI002B0020CC|nr:hypothetical protein [Faecalibacter sp. LW9]